MRSVLAGGLLACAMLQSVWADHVDLEEVLVVGEKDVRRFELAETVDVAPDSAAILKRVVGANVVSNGPLTGIAQYRGMSRFRVSTQINGATISAGGPNWMDPPLSYAPAAHLESIEVYRGIASVSTGVETIGGAIRANTWRGEFSDSGVAFRGRIRTGAQSVNHGEMVSAAMSVAGQRHLLKVSALHEAADDAAFADGDILPTEYERDRVDVGYGVRLGRHTLRIDYGRNETGDGGTPALPMDIGFIDADLLSLGWEFAGEVLQLTSKLHISDIEHGMTNYHLRQPPMMPSMWRQNIATGDNRGFAVAAQWGAWKFGLDGHEESHDSDIDNPNNPMFFVVNFNQAQRRLLGVYLEREFTVGDGWLLEFGARYNRVDMDADEVNATPAVMGMPAAVALRDAFNNADRDSTDHNLDWVAKFNYLANAELNLYAGVSRKSRVPAYQEKYLWLPMQATAGLADGRTYTGNLDLDPEVAHELELGFDWQGGGFALSPRMFYRDVSDYIQGTVSSSMPAVMFVQMMNNMNGTNNARPLQFNNVDATFYGFDLDWRYEINERWWLNGVVNYVRAKRDDVDDDLYRVAAPNAFMAVNYQLPRWHMVLEGFVYDGQDNVSDTNGETVTSGYGVFNLRGWWRIAEGLKLGFGIDNLADRKYVDHLSGYNRVSGNPDIALGARLPAFGRSYFARLDYRW
jgi:iron complex outermembrane receptor protein